MSDELTVRVQVDLSLRWVEEVTVTVPAGLTGETLRQRIEDLAGEKALANARAWVPWTMSRDVEVDSAEVLGGAGRLIEQPTWPPPGPAIYTLPDGSRWATDGACTLDIDRCAPPMRLHRPHWVDGLSPEQISDALVSMRTAGGRTSDGVQLAWQAQYAPVLKSGTARVEGNKVVAIVERDGRTVALVCAALLNPGAALDRYVDLNGNPFPMDVVPELPRVAEVPHGR